MRGLGRFLVAVLAASVTIGIEGALSLLVLVGTDPVVSFAALLPSHASALILIAPLALVPLPRARPSIARRVEGIVQLAVTIAVGVIVFTPTLPVPMIFTLFPLLAWAASRFSPLFVVVELIVVAAIAPTIVVANGGPFGYAQGIDDPGWIVQLFMISAGITALFLSAVRGEREALATEKERQAAVMRGRLPRRPGRVRRPALHADAGHAGPRGECDRRRDRGARMAALGRRELARRSRRRPQSRAHPSRWPQLAGLRQPRARAWRRGHRGHPARRRQRSRRGARGDGARDRARAGRRGGAAGALATEGRLRLGGEPRAADADHEHPGVRGGPR